jgi:hypothetical protein
MTQQNAALVEESAAAADSLREQAARLADVLASFRLDQNAQYTANQAPSAGAHTAMAPRKALPTGRGKSTLFISSDS